MIFSVHVKLFSIILIIYGYIPLNMLKLIYCLHSSFKDLNSISFNLNIDFIFYLNCPAILNGTLLNLTCGPLTFFLVMLHLIYSFDIINIL